MVLFRMIFNIIKIIVIDRIVENDGGVFLWEWRRRMIVFFL